MARRDASPNAPTDTATRSETAARSEAAARNAAIEKILAMFCAAYDREPPDALERKLKVGVWATALGAVPVDELLPLAKRELSERESSFFPVPADLVRRWHARIRLSPEGASNTAAYMPYRPIPAALPEVPPPLQIEPAELKRRLGFVEPRPRSEPEHDDLPGASENWSALLLEVARAGNIALERCSPAQIADLRAFGLWWLANYPRLELNLDNFAGTYEMFSQSRREPI